MKDIPSAFTRPALCNLHSCITLSFSAIDLFLLFTTAAATPLNSLYCSSHHSHCCSHLCWGTSVLVRQRVSAQRAPVRCILGCCLSNLGGTLSLHACHPPTAGIHVVALPGLVTGTPHCVEVITQGRWVGGRLKGAHTWHAQVRIELGCLANAPTCMMGWVTHTFTLEQLILQDVSFELTPKLQDLFSLQNFAFRVPNTS
jgi:hypothetical protein